MKNNNWIKIVFVFLLAGILALLPVMAFITERTFIVNSSSFDTGDSYVTDASAGSNYGTGTTMLTYVSAPSQISYIELNFSSYAMTAVKQAFLYIYSTLSTGTPTATAYYCDDMFNETTITYTNKDTEVTGCYAGNSGTVSGATGWKIFTITANMSKEATSSNKALTYKLIGAGGRYTHNTKENAVKPYLYLNYSLTPTAIHVAIYNESNTAQQLITKSVIVVLDGTIQNTTTTGMTYFTGVSNGIHTIGISSSGAGYRLYTVNKTSSTYYLTTFLLYGGTKTDFLIRNYNNEALPNTLITIKKYITSSATWETMTSDNADVMGKISPYLDPVIKYRFNFSLSGYQGRQFDMYPNSDAYIIKLYANSTYGDYLHYLYNSTPSIIPFNYTHIIANVTPSNTSFISTIGNYKNSIPAFYRVAISFIISLIVGLGFFTLIGATGASLIAISVMSILAYAGFLPMVYAIWIWIFVILGYIVSGGNEGS